VILPALLIFGFFALTGRYAPLKDRSVEQICAAGVCGLLAQGMMQLNVDKKARWIAQLLLAALAYEIYVVIANYLKVDGQSVIPQDMMIGSIILFVGGVSGDLLDGAKKAYTSFTTPTATMQVINEPKDTSPVLVESPEEDQEQAAPLLKQPQQQPIASQAPWYAFMPTHRSYWLLTLFEMVVATTATLGIKRALPYPYDEMVFMLGLLFLTRAAGAAASKPIWDKALEIRNEVRENLKRPGVINPPTPFLAKTLEPLSSLTLDVSPFIGAVLMAVAFRGAPWVIAFPGFLEGIRRCWIDHLMDGPPLAEILNEPSTRKKFTWIAHISRGCLLILLVFFATYDVLKYDKNKPKQLLSTIIQSCFVVLTPMAAFLGSKLIAGAWQPKKSHWIVRLLRYNTAENPAWLGYVAAIFAHWYNKMGGRGPLAYPTVVAIGAQIGLDAAGIDDFKKVVRCYSVFAVLAYTLTIYEYVIPQILNPPNNSTLAYAR